MTTMRVLMEHCQNGQSSELEEDAPMGHSHCNTCIKVTKCAVQPTLNQSCEIVACELNCGFRFHACKLSEHRLLCPNEKVACINAGNGCPVTLIRHQRARHLETCPASVVICTMEWNRWPVCSQERQMHVPFHVPNPRAKEGQLDIALALRDQRMLNEWMKVPRRTRRVLRNSLTKCFPAVPLQSWPSSEGFVPVVAPSSVAEEDEMMWDCKKAPPGLQSSVCSELYKVTRGNLDECTTDSLIHITAKSHTSQYNGSPDLVNSETSTVEESSINGVEYTNRSPSTHLNGILRQQTEIGTCQSSYTQANKRILNNSQSDTSVGLNMESNLNCLEMTEENKENMPDNLNVFESSYNEEQNGHFSVCFVNNTQVSEIFSASMTDHASSIIPPPPSSPPMIVSLGLDLTLESITRYQTKPKNMYTFLCAQEFRRDEYSWHYKNVHSDIHGGLNGWLEHRCPLAHYGCMYSLRRFYPMVKGSTVIHNDTLESFGVKPFVPYEIPVLKRCPKFTSAVQSTTKKAHNFPGFNVQNSEDMQDWSLISSQHLALCQLPFEVLRHVCRFLDSFSLCNLALTCRRLREVCCSLLEERGLVVQQWKKRYIGSKVSWTIAYKRWFFSTAFTPVRQWGFEEEDHMSNHLRSCVCFERNVESKPYFHIFGCEPDPSLHAKLVANNREHSGSPVTEGS
ncbi:F-box only protein 30-like [Periplaneta americana]|uniref:F-box only protein 30-like n=1 Tax=Periplaneta americana TaxID=6978 RepID=UPI0037E76BFF